ncbi:GumC family protein [Salinarimonas sp.]|uniref:GumC family protein n=1 Tax=Salinarimonas sp. TaxID=2766526 RepID=UPI00391A861A
MSVTRTDEPTAGASVGPQSETVDLGQLILAVARRWKAILLVTALAALGALLFAVTAEPRYRGETQVILESRETGFTRPIAATADETSRVIDEQAVTSQVQVIRSRDVAREAVRRLDLVGNPEFDPTVRPMNPITRVRMMLGLGGAGREEAAVERVLRAYYERLLVYVVPRSRVITIEFRSADPELAARAANVIAEVYLETLEAAKIETARSASTWLSQNIDRLREQVREAEARVEAFRAGRGLLVGANNVTLTSQQLDNLNAQLVAARTQQSDSAARAALIRELIAQGRAFDIPDVVNNDLVRGLIAQRVSLRAQIANESRTLLPQHPRLIALEAQLADLDGQIRGAAERTVRGLEGEARLAGERVTALEAALDRQMGVASQANENEVQLRALEREARAEREQLEVFLARYRDAVARDSDEATLPDARIVSRAAVPDEPVFPRKGPILILATATALMLAIGTVLLKALLFDGARARLPEPAARPAPAAIARGAVEPLADPDGDPPEGGPAGRRRLLRDRQPSEPGRAAIGVDVPALVARMLRADVDERGRRVLVCALGRDEDGAAVGDPISAARLAEALARELPGSLPVLVVALDAAPGTVPTDAAGLADLVAGEARFFEAIAASPGARLHRIGPGEPALDPADPEIADALEITLSAFDQTYEASLLVLADPLDPALLALVGERVDTAILAARTSPDDPDLVAVYQALRAAGAPDVVVALSGEDAAEGRASPSSGEAAA